jgi:hypothetical protein
MLEHCPLRERVGKCRPRRVTLGRRWVAMGGRPPGGQAGAVEDDPSEKEKTPSERGFQEARPAGFEPATSRSGGERSIH